MIPLSLRFLSSKEKKNFLSLSLSLFASSFILPVIPR